MSQTMTLSRETIFENIREVLEEALGADAEDITPDATGCPVRLPRVPATLTSALWQATGVAFRSLGSVG